MFPAYRLQRRLYLRRFMDAVVPDGKPAPVTAFSTAWRSTKRPCRRLLHQQHLSAPDHDREAGMDARPGLR